MSDDNDQLLDCDFSCKETEYTESDGGDSVLDSDDDSPSRDLPEPKYHVSTSLVSNGSKILQLEGRKKFRCIPDVLPTVPLSKKMKKRKKFVHLRRLTKPTLLLELPENDCRYKLDTSHLLQRQRIVEEKEIINETVPATLNLCDPQSYTKPESNPFFAALQKDTPPSTTTNHSSFSFSLTDILKQQ